MEETDKDFNRSGVWWKIKPSQLCEIYLQISYNEKYNIQKIELYA